MKNREPEIKNQTNISLDRYKVTLQAQQPGLQKCFAPRQRPQQRCTPSLRQLAAIDGENSPSSNHFWQTLKNSLVSSWCTGPRSKWNLSLKGAAAYDFGVFQLFFHANVLYALYKVAHSIRTEPLNIVCSLANIFACVHLLAALTSLLC